jgi:hypothetical protein
MKTGEIWKCKISTPEVNVGDLIEITKITKNRGDVCYTNLSNNIFSYTPRQSFEMKFIKVYNAGRNVIY